MKNQERYETTPHIDLIVKNGSVTIPSIFMFGKDTGGLFLFITACRELNCTLHFENESLTFDPKEYDSAMNVKLTSYMGIMARPEFAENYMRYLFHKDEMKFIKRLLWIMVVIIGAPMLYSYW